MPPGSEEDADADADEDTDADADVDEGPPRTTGPPDERILAPEDLDFTDDEKVEQLDEGKFVIGTDSRPSVPPEERTDESTGASPDPSPSRPSPSPSEPEDTPDETPSKSESTDTVSPSAGSRPPRRDPSDPAELSGRAVKRFISTELRRTDSQYAYRIAAKTGETVSHQQLASDDIGMAFDGLLMWYAQQVSSDTAVEDALGILLAKSNIRIRYPIKQLTAYLREHELSPEDDIGDLLEVIRAEDGLVFPPGSRR